MAEIEPERRNGYAWYGAWGTRVEENYNGWKANRAKAETPKTGEKS